VRVAALLRALRAREPEVQLRVRSEAPHWLFSRRDRGTECSQARVDVGVLQEGGLDVDLPSTLEAHETFVAEWEQHLARETAWLRRSAAKLVVGDVPPLAFAAAARAGLPAVAIANFSWDWILEPYAAAEPRFAPVVDLYRRAYGEADLLYRLPFCGEFPAFREVRDAPLLAHRSGCGRDEVFAHLGLATQDPRPVVLVSFGGFGSGEIEAKRWDDLRGYRFLGHGAAPPGLPAEWTSLPREGAVEHEDLVATCDVLVGKPGYSTCAEVVAHGARFLHLPRSDFREVPVLEAALDAYDSARSMARSDFFEGRWKRHLDAITALPRAQPVAAPGADVLAEALLDRLR
jgi:hypothetical protein